MIVCVGARFRAAIHPIEPFFDAHRRRWRQVRGQVSDISLSPPQQHEPQANGNCNRNAASQENHPRKLGRADHAARRGGPPGNPADERWGQLQRRVELGIAGFIGLQPEEVSDEPHVLANVLPDRQPSRRVVHDQMEEPPTRFVGRPPHLIQRHRFVLLVGIIEREFDIEFHDLPEVQIDLEDFPRLAEVARSGAKLVVCRIRLRHPGEQPSVRLIDHPADEPLIGRIVLLRDEQRAIAHIVILLDGGLRLVGVFIGRTGCSRNLLRVGGNDGRRLRFGRLMRFPRYLLRFAAIGIFLNSLIRLPRLAD